MDIDVKKLNSIDLTKLSKRILDEEAKGYFLGNPGEEHYKLLAYLSTRVNEKPVIDVGTYKGCSALALSYNLKNSVYSFDITPGLNKISYLAHSGNWNNIIFAIDDITDPKYNDLIKESELILLDTYHDGIFEIKFYNHLVNLNWKGLLILDDIKLNTEMKNFWEFIYHDKEDISEYGHHSGTGAVWFK